LVLQDLKERMRAKMGAELFQITEYKSLTIAKVETGFIEQPSFFVVSKIVKAVNATIENLIQ
jgi:hypothetical protein